MRLGPFIMTLASCIHWSNIVRIAFPVVVWTTIGRFSIPSLQIDLGAQKLKPKFLVWCKNCVQHWPTRTNYTPTRNHHGSLLCQNPTTMQTVTYLHIFVHIKPLSNATNHIDVPHGHPWEKPKNPISIDSSTCLHVRSLAPDLTPCATKDSWLTNQIMDTHDTMKA